MEVSLGMMMSWFMVLSFVGREYLSYAFEKSSFMSLFHLNLPPLSTYWLVASFSFNICCISGFIVSIFGTALIVC